MLIFKMLDKIILSMLILRNYIFFFYLDGFDETTTTAISPTEGEVLLLMGEDTLQPLKKILCY